MAATMCGLYHKTSGSDSEDFVVSLQFQFMPEYHYKLKVKLAKAILQMLQVQKLLLRLGLLLVNLVVTTVLLTVNTLVSTNYQHHTLTVTTQQLTKNGLLTNTLQVVTVHGKMLRLTGKLTAGTKI